ncbi:DUF4113 domain-containing protein [Spartinivicinus ruber]
MFLASTGTNQGWQMARQHLSPNYMTDWAEIPLVRL